MRIHFIAIGGAAMHNLALALYSKGYNVTGSDDEISEPSKSRLDRVGLLPSEMGWYPEKITADIDAIILGMHARIDNPELVRAKELGLKIFSYPEYLYEQSKDKRRVVIGGSHGKTSITAMILHVLSGCNMQFDYMVGSQLEGFDTMVRLSHDAPVIILEGDEYLSSPIDRRPKFHLYHADIALLSGIAWDHINVFPTFDNYVEQFRIFVRQLPADGTLVYCENDNEVVGASIEANVGVNKIGYTVPAHEIRDGITYLQTDAGEISLMVFGKHNLMNLEGARNVCNQLGVTNEQFYQAISTFKGAARRLELVSRSNERIVYKDFAHSPSKLKATIAAVKEQFTKRGLIACMELHTFSSLNATFLDEYANSMDMADEAIVYFNAHTIEHKKLPPITVEQVRKSFAREDIIVIDTTEALKSHLDSIPKNGDVMLMMSSGTFDGLDLKLI